MQKLSEDLATERCCLEEKVKQLKEVLSVCLGFFHLNKPSDMLRSENFELMGQNLLNDKWPLTHSSILILVLRRIQFDNEMIKWFQTCSCKPSGPPKIFAVVNMVMQTMMDFNVN